MIDYPEPYEIDERIRELAREEIRAAAADFTEGSQLLALTRAITLGAEAVARDEISRFAQLLAHEMELLAGSPARQAVQAALARFKAGQQA